MSTIMVAAEIYFGWRELGRNAFFCFYEVCLPWSAVEREAEEGEEGMQHPEKHHHHHCSSSSSRLLHTAHKRKEAMGVGSQVAERRRLHTHGCGRQRKETSTKRP